MKNGSKNKSVAFIFLFSVLSRQTDIRSLYFWHITVPEAGVYNASTATCYMLTLEKHVILVANIAKTPRPRNADQSEQTVHFQEGGLKRQVLNRAFQTEGEYRYSQVGSMTKNNVFFLP